MKKLFFLIMIILLCFRIYSEQNLKTFTLSLKVFPLDTIVYFNGEKKDPASRQGATQNFYLTEGKHNILCTAEGYYNYTADVEITKNRLLEIKLERKASRLHLVAEINCGRNPKSVEFTPDGKYLITALLEGEGIEIYTVDNLSLYKKVTFPGQYKSQHGFVEIAFVHHKNEIWVSQMTTATIHIIDALSFRYKESVGTGGIWPKVICISSDEKYAFVSNWCSNDISVIDIDSRRLIKRIPVFGVPRGMAITPDNKYLYVCLYDNGNIEKVDIDKLKSIKTLYLGYGAKRHAVLDKKGSRLYVSDMYQNIIYVISLKDDKVIKKIPVGNLPNTIALSADDRYLFVSTRGENNPYGYYLKGPEFGKIFIIDTGKLEVVDWIWGKNQPTGLDVSPNKKIMVYSNFLDDTIEVYDVRKLWGQEYVFYHSLSEMVSPLFCPLNWQASLMLCDDLIYPLLDSE